MNDTIPVYRPVAGSACLNDPPRDRTEAALDQAVKLLRRARLKVPKYLADDIDKTLSTIAELRAPAHSAAEATAALADWSAGIDDGTA